MRRGGKELYKGKYYIGIYDDDCPIFIAENAEDLAEYLGTSITFVRAKLKRLFDGIDKKIAVGERYCTVSFIDMSEED